ncbi:MAG: polyprenol monophosphomannose synthase [Candidatus Omnitrophica bacterium]|nr:polyprenol monophosphomannose synthase [Candidatus Omnitrophota bacterium]
MISIVLPTYNERENISQLVEAILHSVSEPLELLIVDDNSPDRTWEVAEALEKRFRGVRLIRRMEKRGLTAALNEGLSRSKGEKLLWMDADFSMPPESIPHLLAALEQAPVAIGSRYVKGGRDLRDARMAVLLSGWFNRLATFLLGNVTDYTSGFVAIRKEVWEQIGLSGRHGEYCIRLLYEAKRAGYPIKEIPYACRPRRRGQSKTFASPWEAFRNGKEYLWTLLSLWLRR